MVKCKFCGKEFKNPHSIGGHIIWCNKNPNKSGKSNFNVHKHINTKINFNYDSKFLENRNDLFCQYCGKQCKNLCSLKQHEIRCPKNENRLETSISPICKKGHIPWNKGLTKETDERIKKRSETLSKKFKSGELKGSMSGKHLSLESRKKISKSVSKYYKENPDKVPYLINHSSKISYPEQYFIDLFNKENIDLKYHLQISLYELDFYNEDLKIDVEIDGEQHFRNEKSIIRDDRRNKYLENLGWHIFRIRWSEYKKMNEEEKHNKIEELKIFIKNLTL